MTTVFGSLCSLLLGLEGSDVSVVCRKKVVLFHFPAFSSLAIRLCLRRDLQNKNVPFPCVSHAPVLHNSQGEPDGSVGLCALTYILTLSISASSLLLAGASFLQSEGTYIFDQVRPGSPIDEYCSKGAGLTRLNAAASAMLKQMAYLYPMPDCLGPD